MNSKISNRLNTNFSFAVLMIFVYLIVFLSSCTSGDEQQKQKKQDATDSSRYSDFKDTSIVTVSQIRDSKGGKSVEVLFNERQAIFIFKRDSKDFKSFITNLDTSFKNNLPLKLISDEKGEIKSLNKLNEKELLLFNERKKYIIKSEVKPAVMKEKKLDTIAFNRPDKIRFPAFALCTKVMEYSKAVEIFNYCAKQSCSAPGPYDITPCIPFQYVIDGCYARAHKMRWIIENKFGYCCQKIFSFANIDPDQLAVKASKWGGCCVTWWYHVAPVVQVKLNGNTLCYVIDPGMFNNPVTIYTWLEAQENFACSPTADISMYTIQPPEAYWPANHNGTAFGTDPSYTLTNGTLNNYKPLHTCH